jgi:hypothetical protein
MSKLFSLDVDDAIWQDIGLDESGDVDEPPLWLCDEMVRKGIQGVLLRDRCDEEFYFLRRERRALHEWFAEEWLIVNESVELTSQLGELILYVSFHSLSAGQIWYTNYSNGETVSCAYVLYGGNLSVRFRQMTRYLHGAHRTRNWL